MCDLRGRVDVNEVSAIRIAPRAAADVNLHGKRACVKICFANACKPDGAWDGEIPPLAG